MFITLLLVGFTLGLITAYWFCRHNMVIDEITYLRNDFKKIHDRLLAALSEWQKKV